MGRSIETTPRPLWCCPKCGARLVTANGWHSCGRATLADWTARMTPRVRRLHQRFERLLAECGPFEVAPARTRLAYLARVRFASITRVTPDAMTVTFALPHPVRSTRLDKVSEAVPGWWVHVLRVRSPDELDAEVGGWLCRSYRLMGLRERLRRPVR